MNKNFVIQRKSTSFAYKGNDEVEEKIINFKGKNEK